MVWIKHFDNLENLEHFENWHVVFSFRSIYELSWTRCFWVLLVQYKDVIFSCFYFSSSSGNLDHVNSILNSDTNGFASFKTSGITLANLLSNSDNVNGFGDIGSSRNVAWSNGTDSHSHDSGIGHSPPFDNGLRYLLYVLNFPAFFCAILNGELRRLIVKE